MAVAISSRSSERTRRTMFSSAVSNGRPRFTSRMTRPNSVEIGGRDLADHQLDRLEERGAGAQGVGDEGDRVRQLLVERAETAVLAAVQPEAREPEADAAPRRGARSGCRAPAARRTAGGTPRHAHDGRGPDHQVLARPSGAGRRGRGRGRGWRPKSRCSTALLKRCERLGLEIISPRFCWPPALDRLVLAGRVALEAGIDRRAAAGSRERRWRSGGSPGAATPAMTSVVGSIEGAPLSVSTEAEEAGRQVDAHRLELLDELGADARRLAGGPGSARRRSRSARRRRRPA